MVVDMQDKQGAVKHVSLYFYGAYHVPEDVRLCCGLRDCSLTSVQVAYAKRMPQEGEPPALAPDTPVVLVPLCIYHFVRFRKLLEDTGKPI